MKKGEVLNRMFVFFVVVTTVAFLIVGNNAFGSTIKKSHSELGMNQYFDHVHFIVKDLDKAMETYEKLLGVKPSDKGGFIRDFPLGRIGMLPIPGAIPGFRLEMLEIAPSVQQEDNRISRFLKKRSEGVGGLSIFVEDFDGVVEDLRKKGVAVEIETATVVDPKYPFRIGWVEPEEAHGAWIELVDSLAVPPFEKDWDLEFRGNTSLYFDHIHFIVKDVDEATKTYEKLLGLKPEGKGSLKSDRPGFRMRMLPIRGSRIEMLEVGTEPDMANRISFRMSQFLRDHGEGVGGLSIFVKDFDGVVKDLREKGFAVEVVVPSKGSKFAFRTAWVEAEEAHGVWIEYVETKAVPQYERDWWRLD